jgi:hypothetical protein
MGSMMKITDYLLYAVKTVGVIAFLPFLLPAYLIARVLGIDPFSLDGMGLGFLITIAIAGALAIGTGFFFLGTLI